MRLPKSSDSNRDADFVLRRYCDRHIGSTIASKSRNRANDINTRLDSLRKFKMNQNREDSRCLECGRRLNKPFDFETRNRKCWCGADIPRELWLRFVVADIPEKFVFKVT